MNKENVGQFFDTLTEAYTETIERCFPRYREMLWGLLDYLPRDRPYASILELGCGTGNLSVLLHETLPEARLHLVDIAPDSLDVCRTRLKGADKVDFEQRDFRDLVLEDQQFDLIVSNIAVHHLPSSEKRVLFQKCRRWLREHGIFSFADQCAGVTDDLYTRHMENWKSASFDAGTTTEEWEMWMRHQAEHDHHDSLGDQFDWLHEAGFSQVDCTWRYLLWAVIQARK